MGPPSFPGTLGPRMVNLPGALPFGNAKASFAAPEPPLLRALALVSLPSAATAAAYSPPQPSHARVSLGEERTGATVTVVGPEGPEE